MKASRITARGFKTRSAEAGNCAVIRVLIFLTTNLSLWLIRVLAPGVFSPGFSGFPPPTNKKTFRIPIWSVNSGWRSTLKMYFEVIPPKSNLPTKVSYFRRSDLPPRYVAVICLLIYVQLFIKFAFLRSLIMGVRKDTVINSKVRFVWYNSNFSIRRSFADNGIRVIPRDIFTNLHNLEFL